MFELGDIRMEHTTLSYEYVDLDINSRVLERQKPAHFRGKGVSRNGQPLRKSSSRAHDLHGGKPRDEDHVCFPRPALDMP